MLNILAVVVWEATVAAMARRLESHRVNCCTGQGLRSTMMMKAQLLIASLSMIELTVENSRLQLQLHMVRLCVWTAVPFPCQAAYCIRCGYPLSSVWSLGLAFLCFHFFSSCPFLETQLTSSYPHNA